MAIKLSGLSAQNVWWRGEDWAKNDNDLEIVDTVFQRKKNRHQKRRNPPAAWGETTRKNNSLSGKKTINVIPIWKWLLT